MFYRVPPHFSYDNNFCLFSCCGIAVTCPGLYEGYNIKWSPNHTTYSYNDIVNFQCDAGYQLSGPSSLVCQADGHESIGHWSKKQPACVGRNVLKVNVSIYTLIIHQFKYAALLYIRDIGFLFPMILQDVVKRSNTTESKYTHTHTHTRARAHARTHKRTHARTHKRTHARTLAHTILFGEHKTCTRLQNMHMHYKNVP
jgi:hypothetical protein